MLECACTCTRHFTLCVLCVVFVCVCMCVHILISSMSWVRIPSEQLFSIFHGKRDVQVTCSYIIALFLFVHVLEFPCKY